MNRFACPGCKCVLAGRDEHAGKIVICPKCGARMVAPRQQAAARERQHRPAGRRVSIAGSALIVLASLVGAGGIWSWTHLQNAEAERVVAARFQRALEETQPDRHVENVLPQAERHVENVPPQAGRHVENVPPQAERHVENVPPQGSRTNKQPEQKPPVQKPLPAAEKKEIALADDLPPELPFDLVDAINVQRAKAGVGPIFLDAEPSRACQSRAEELARHPDKGPVGKPETEFVAAGAPLAAIEKWLQEPTRRAAILEPRLRTFAAGFARNVDGQWFSIFDWTRGIDHGPPLEAAPVQGAIVYPAPGQMRVPLWFPGNEVPDPLPQTKEKRAGYPVTLTFPPRTRIEEVALRLSDKQESDIASWLSSPEKPANPQFPQSQQNTICLIAKKPLQPNTRYHVEVSAKINGAAWSAKWDFVTVSEGEIHHELAGRFLRTLNKLRRRAGLPPVSLDLERSKPCAAHARYLVRNALDHPTLNWNDERAELPGYTAEGAVVARTAAIQGGGGPTEAVAGLIDSLLSRQQLLDPRLHHLGLGYTPFSFGGWIWVFDFQWAVGGKGGKEYFYPAPEQENVPLIYPPNEVPSPIPRERNGQRGNEEGLAGYAITVLFDTGASVTAAAAKLVDDKGTSVDGWLSSPDKPAIAGFPQRSMCFLPKAPLRPDTHYTASFEATVNGKAWRRAWNFTTIKEPDRYADDLDRIMLARVNAARNAAGLSLVRLDPELSRDCQSHARYLAHNHLSPEIQGMGMHRQNAELPGASPEGARAAKESVIAVVLDPQTCIENWMATFYHRLPILTPNLERIGFGHARMEGHKWVCVLDTGNGRPRQK